MSLHFSSFTSEAMNAIGQRLAAEQRERRERLENNRSLTQALLADAQRERRETESRRRGQAAQEADARRLFMSELRSGVHALRNRFELARREMAADFQHMAGELRAAREALRNRPGDPLETAAFRNVHPAPEPARPMKPAPEPAEAAPLPVEKASPVDLAPPAKPRPAAAAAKPQKEEPPEARPKHNRMEKKPAFSKKRRI